MDLFPVSEGRSNSLNPFETKRKKSPKRSNNLFFILKVAGFQGLWTQLFPAEQARITQLLVRRITVTAEGLVIDLRTDGIAGVMRELMKPRRLEAAE